MPVAIAKMLGSRMMSALVKPACSVSSRWARVRTSIRRSTESAWPCSSKAITTAAAPYRRHSRAWRRNSSSPSLRLIELTTPRPWSWRRPASMTDHLELSTMTGTAAMSGSAASRRRNRVMAATPSSIASSMFTSIITAPFTTWSRAIATASSSPARSSPTAPAISRANLREPVTLVRSPTLTKAPPGIGMVSGSRPARWVAVPRSGMTRGAMPATAAAMAAVCSGVEPQQEPATLSRPARAHSPSAGAISSGRLVVAAQLVGEAGVGVGGAARRRRGARAPRRARGAASGRGRS